MVVVSLGFAVVVSGVLVVFCFTRSVVIKSAIFVGSVGLKVVVSTI